MKLDRQIKSSSSAKLNKPTKPSKPILNTLDRSLPVSYLIKKYSAINPINFVEDKVIYGNLNAVSMCKSSEEKKKCLQKIVTDCFEQIMNNNKIRGVNSFMQLVLYIANHTGALFSNENVGREVGLSGHTVKKYVDILIKYGLIFRLDGYKNRLAEEVSKFHKYFFTDLGIRNTIVGNFYNINHRKDAEIVWKNFLILEQRIKQRNSSKISTYFWKHHEGYEIDFLIVTNQKASQVSYKAFNFALKQVSSTRQIPAILKKTYPEVSYRCIGLSNFQEFI
jgi:predicted AAA+ superfamily ATPase